MTPVGNSHVSIVLIPSKDLCDDESAVGHRGNSAHAHVVEVDVGKVSMVAIPHWQTQQEALAVASEHWRVVYISPAVQCVLCVDL